MSRDTGIVSGSSKAFGSALLLCIVLFSCTGSKSGEEADDRTPSAIDVVLDDVGREVILAETPERIVSLAPNATEILFAVGAGDRVIGVTEYCNFPPEARKIEKVGSFSFLNIERILSLAPDLVLISSHEQERFIKTLDELEIPVYVCFPRNFQELFRTIHSIGRVTGSPVRARALADSLGAELDRLKGEVEWAFSSEERLKVYMEISSRPLMTAGDHSFIGTMIDVAGGRNIGHDLPRDYAVINSEVVISRNPEVIFIFHYSSTRENLLERLGWDRIDAVKADMIFDDLDEDVVHRPGPRSVRGAREMFERLLTAKERYDRDPEQR
jgi:iron complex transport system substrate-binding protein